MGETRFPSRFGKYILLDRLNSGGMAEVYRAKVTGVERFERLVAIKCMLPALAEDRQFTTMFIDEAKLAAQLTHPNIVQIHELGRIGQRLYIAMELVTGRDLRHVVRTAQRRGVKLPTTFAAYCLAKAAEGLDFAHRKVGLDGKPLSLVHRDVSPQNILVSYDGDVKVVDFGIAKASARATETQAGTLKGKFAYMAPEQVAGTETDRRADIFALGTVLYEVLAGQRLFNGDNDMAILDKVSRVDTSAVEQLLADPGLAELRPVFARTLTRSPDDRFAWASEVAESLEPLLIENRSIFGAKRAAQLMQSLYADEIADYARRAREYAAVREDDAGGAPVDVGRGEQVFETGFGKALPRAAPRPSELPPTQPPTGGWGADDLAGKTIQFPALDGSDTDRAGAAGPTSSALIDTEEAPAQASDPPFPKTERREAPPPPRSSGVLWLAIVALIAALVGLGAVLLLEGRPVSELPAIVTALVQSARPRPAPRVAPGPALAPAAGVTASPALPPAPAPAPVAIPAPVPASVPAVIPAPAPASAPVVLPASASPPAARPATNGDAGAHGPAEPRYGFISVAVPGSSARVFVDGEEVGQTPLVGHRLKVGKHTVKVVETGAGQRARTDEVTVTGADSKKTPVKVIVRF
jgi:hypothetical protein